MLKYDTVRHARLPGRQRSRTTQFPHQQAKFLVKLGWGVGMIGSGLATVVLGLLLVSRNINTAKNIVFISPNQDGLINELLLANFSNELPKLRLIRGPINPPLQLSDANLKLQLSDRLGRVISDIEFGSGWPESLSAGGWRKWWWGQWWSGRWICGQRGWR